MKLKPLLLFLLASLMISSSLYSQSDLHIFGFYQARFTKVDGSYSVTGDIPTLAGPVSTKLSSIETSYASSAIQQMNIFARKEITNHFTSFISLEIVNNFSSENEWGSFKLEEAWLEYHYTDFLKIQAGLIVPKFNYMNEIKNKTPLLASVMRPLVYESSLNGSINGNEYVPERAFLQLTGELPVNKFVFDYAAYVGPAEEDYTVSGQAANSVEPGLDSTNFLLYGARVGLKYDDLRLGASVSYDKEKEEGSGLDDVNRLRLGFDFGYNFHGVFVEAEYIKVMLSAEEDEEDEEDADKTFYYGQLGYNFTESLYAYGMYSRIKDAEVDFLSNGMTAIAGGIGFRPTFGVVVKMEYANYFVADDAQINDLVIIPGMPGIDADMDLNYKSFNLAVSVMF